MAVKDEAHVAAHRNAVDLAFVGSLFLRLAEQSAVPGAGDGGVTDRHEHHPDAVLDRYVHGLIPPEGSLSEAAPPPRHVERRHQPARNGRGGSTSDVCESTSHRSSIRELRDT